MNNEQEELVTTMRTVFREELARAAENQLILNDEERRYIRMQIKQEEDRADLRRDLKKKTIGAAVLGTGGIMVLAVGEFIILKVKQALGII